MRALPVQIIAAWNRLPVFLQTSLLLGATAYFLLHLGKSLGQALYYLTN